jgi:hypothetical protein
MYRKTDFYSICKLFTVEVRQRWNQFFLIRIVWGGVQAGSTRHVCPGWLWWWRIWWSEDWQGKPKYSEKTCPSATLSTTNPTWADPGLNPGRHGGKPATNRLSYGAATLEPVTKQRSRNCSEFSVKRDCLICTFSHWSSFPAISCF